MGVQELVSLVGVGFAEEFLVNLLHDGVLMRLSVFQLFCVRLVENGSTESLEVYVVTNGSGLYVPS